jgi:hypothetical protein
MDLSRICLKAIETACQSGYSPQKRFVWTEAVRYDDVYQFFGWPDRRQVFEPNGAGARVYADEVKRKIGSELRRRFPNLTVETGVLAADPNSDSTEAPIAIVCEFPSRASENALKEAHRLAWNFSRTALLITLEPHRLLAWSCWLDPGKNEPPQVGQWHELPRTHDTAPNALQASARDLLHWVSLITGNYLKQQPEKFRSDERADALLLENMKVVRRELFSLGLERRYCHDLLARIIFAQFLFHRKDSDGLAFLDEKLLEERCEGELTKVHTDLGSILADGDETYRFFRWLDKRFNGDLFPGKEDQAEAERDEAWRQEKEAVTRNPAVLSRLAEFVSGSLRLKNRQLTLWPVYSFDVIPLEFISSVYEEFLTEDKHKAKAYYTPSHLVDFVLDGVLPWKDDNYDVKILDPCCGSGIFLVKAFQRLIHRWRRTHAGDAKVPDLKPILENSLWGIDRDPEAVRVACFSLYLAMADAIEPKHYLKGESVFPHLRGRRLLNCDFFNEASEGIRTIEDAGEFDIVTGNAPWGKGTTKGTSDPVEEAKSGEAAPSLSRGRRRVKPKAPPTKAEIWAHRNSWPVAYHDIGPLFLAKGAALAIEGGQVSMVQPATTLLYQRARNAVNLRKKIFASFEVTEVANLTALRRELFPQAVGPCCVITLTKKAPDPSESLLYFCPKPQRDPQAVIRFVIEPQDVHQVTHSEASGDPLVWSALAIGGRRDLALVRRLRRGSNVKKLERSGAVMTRVGVIPGDKTLALPNLKGIPYFEEENFPSGTFLEFDASGVPSWEDPRVSAKDSTDFEPFKQPQMLVKESYSVEEGRFRAAIVRGRDGEWGVISKETYLTVRDLSPDERHIRSACLTYNSDLATYFLALTASRFPFFNTELPANELCSVPLPPLEQVELEKISSYDHINALINEACNLTIAEKVLVEDLLDFPLQDALRKTDCPGYARTMRQIGDSKAEKDNVASYASFLLRVLKATFGKDKSICATVFVEPNAEHLPVRLAALHFDWPGRKTLKVEAMDKSGLFKKLRLLSQNVLSSRSRASSGDGLGFQRVAFLFHSHIEGGRRIPSLYVIKPDQRRYWTRSLAMRDADQLSATILHAARRRGSKS